MLYEDLRVDLERQFIRPEHSAALQEKVERLRLEPGLRETERF